MLPFRLAAFVGAMSVGLFSMASVGAAASPRQLFNGKDLSGWVAWLGKPHASVDWPDAAKDDKGNYTQPLGPGRDPFKVFAIETVDGQPAIHISGQVFGGIRTSEVFSNYHLRLQFKWGEKRWPPRDAAVRDSGLLYHVHGDWDFDGKTWPRGPELQIQEHDVGDLFAIGTQMSVLARRLDPGKRLFQYDPVAGVKTEFLQEPPIGNRCIKGADYEKANGEWNTVELVTLGDESIHIVNGVVVMRLTQARRLDSGKAVPLTSGNILLQSEGAEIYYRHIELRPITAVPVEFAAK